jgi:hypothetical protein
MDDLLGIRDLFREEARTILDRLRLRLPELAGHLADGHGLADVVADGVALKGSGALVGLPVVSRAGVLIVRAAELAAGRAPDDLAAATEVVESLQASLGALERLLDACLDQDASAQDGLLAEVLGHFTPRDRSMLRNAIEGEGTTAWLEGGAGKAETAHIRGETLDGLVASLTDLLVADTQLGGVEREIEALVASLDQEPPRIGDAGAVVRQVLAALGSRVAPARALTRAAAELHRRLGELGLPPTPVESLMVLHVGEARYALAADDAQVVAPAAGGAPPDGTGRTTISFDGDLLPALDLGTCLGEAAPTAPATAVIVDAAGARFAVLVGRAEAPRLMVRRPLDPLLATHPLLRDATVGPGGMVVFVLRADALLGVLQGRIELPSDSARRPTHA